jgi:hypothetical protein
MESARSLLRIVADEIEFNIKDLVPREGRVMIGDKPNLVHFDIAVRKCLHEICKIYSEPNLVALKVG